MGPDLEPPVEKACPYCRALTSDDPGCPECRLKWCYKCEMDYNICPCDLDKENENE